MAKTMAEAAREQLKRADEPKAEPKEAPKKKKKTDPAEIFDSMTPQQQKELLKHIKEKSQYDSSGNEKRTQRLTLVLRPSLVKRAKEAAEENDYRSLTEFLEEAITEKLERI